MLAFMLIHIKQYALHADQMFSPSINVTLPDAAGLEELDAVLEEVEEFYQVSQVSLLVGRVGRLVGWLVGWLVDLFVWLAFGGLTWWLVACLLG